MQAAKILAPNLICTVGTSLFYPNLKNLNPETAYQNSQKQQSSDLKSLEKMGWLDKPEDLKARLFEIKAVFDNKDFSRVGSLFVDLPADLRLLGAEVNSIEAMIRKGFLPQNRERLILFVSDTSDGEAIGQVLSSYFLHPSCPISFEQCIVEVVEGLQDEKPLIFQTKGLTNLARLLGEHYRKWGGMISINATGGYKAQIALGVAFGQATGAMVYYKHERFDQIIRFPRIPFTLDINLVRDNLKLWADLAEPGNSFTEKELGVLIKDQEVFDSMLPLLDRLEEGNEVLVSLSALGMVYWEAFRATRPETALKPKESTVRRGCHFRDDHYPVGFKEHVQKFYDAFPGYVSECHSVPYDGQASITNRFYLRKDKIMGEYKDRNGFGGRFEVLTSAANELERAWLQEKFKKWLHKH